MERAKTALVDSDPTVDAYLELVRAHEEMATALARVFQGHGVTQQQYNVLRILYVRDKGDGPTRVVELVLRRTARSPPGPGRRWS